ncbi:hypothetical protein M8R50_16695 [Enterobacter bugandensis]|uniref:hypothetical protein n=1 Tax=Enterobacter bugandensis TaxID=881260 RepID=UPI0020760018|nr:hypothetical protein [Enterobacter bugandensis]MCM7239187.1 hypothetical protein [Enterobacter bugandensis]MCM7319115.1 hypothetical protein [Enterobacter bugandensis]MCM7354558.1 hypothetical protein [Enterobacter bugandensis]
MILNNPFISVSNLILKLLGDTQNSKDIPNFINNFRFAVNDSSTSGLSCPAPGCSHVTPLEGEAGRTQIRRHIGEQHPGMDAALFDTEMDQRVRNLQHQESPETEQGQPANLGAPVADAAVLAGVIEVLDAEQPPGPLPVVPAPVILAGYAARKAGQAAEKTVAAVSKAVSAAVSQIHSTKASGASTPATLKAGYSGLKKSLKHSLGNEPKASPSSGPNTPKLSRSQPVATTSSYSPEGSGKITDELSSATQAVLPVASKTTQYRSILPKYFSGQVTMAVDDGKPYPCAFCSKSYSREADLKGHTTKKHGDYNVRF